MKISINFGLGFKQANNMSHKCSQTRRILLTLKANIYAIWRELITPRNVDICQR